MYFRVMRWDTGFGFCQRISVPFGVDRVRVFVVAVVIYHKYLCHIEQWIESSKNLERKAKKFIIKIHTHYKMYQVWSVIR